MKICYINYLSPSLIHGGAERVVYEEAKMIVDSDNEAFIISLKNDENISEITHLYDGKIRNYFLSYIIRLSESTLSKGIEIVKSIYNPTLIPQFRKIIINEKPDIVHIHQLGPISLSVLKEIKKLGIKYVRTFHGYYFECPKGSLFRRSGKLCTFPPFYCNVYKKYFYNTTEQCDQIIAVSSYVKKRLLNAGYSYDKITLIHNNISNISNAPYYSKDSMQKEILFVGRMTKVKGVQFLLKALTQISISSDKYIVNMIGDGKDRPLFEKMAKSLSINVNFLGKVPEEVLEQYYKRAWVVAVPSIFPELCPMVPLEAAAHGTPVIASKIGGMSDVVEHGHTGFLVELGNVKELANYLEILLKNEEMAKNMGINAIFFVSKFSRENKLKLLLDLYNKILVQ